MVHSLMFRKDDRECKVEPEDDAGVGDEEFGQSAADLDEDEGLCTNVRVDTDHREEVDPDEED